MRDFFSFFADKISIVLGYFLFLIFYNVVLRPRISWSTLAVFSFIGFYSSACIQTPFPDLPTCGELHGKGKRYDFFYIS